MKWMELQLVCINSTNRAVKFYLKQDGNTKNWVSEALNIMSKHVKINIQTSKYVWADVDNLVDLKSANKIIKNMETK